MTDPRPTLTADEFQALCDLLWPNADATARAAALGVSRVTYYKWKKGGLTAPATIDRLKDLAANAVTELRRRARALDRFTTS